MAIGNLLGLTPDRNRLGIDPERAAGNVSNTRSGFSDFLNNIISRGQQSLEQPRMTARDLFGEQIQRLQDRAGSAANATKRAISRGMMASGGDRSGVGASRMLQADEQLSQNQQDIAGRFTQLAEQVNQQERSRAQNLLSQGLQGRQNLLTFDYGRLRDTITREAQKEQARKQRFSSILGNIIQGGATAASAAICWVAAELYGEDSPEFHITRGFLLSREGSGDAFDEFLQVYREHGEAWAEKIKEDPALRADMAELFDKFYELGKAA